MEMVSNPGPHANPVDFKLLEYLSDRILVDSGCWQWIGPKGGGMNQFGVVGYGRYGNQTSKRVAHHVVYELVTGLRITRPTHKLCDNGLCVNPGYLLVRG